MISLHQAHKFIGMLHPLPPVCTPLDQAFGLVCAENVYAAANCPSVDSSLKDGFAVLADDIADASSGNSVTLHVVGAVSAGDDAGIDAGIFNVISGTAVRIMTGAPLPRGATSVLASEFAEVNGDTVTISADARPGRNILRKGSDIMQDQRILAKDSLLGPAHLGLLAAAGLREVLCVLITCGGVLDGDKDLTMRAMEQIGMEKIFHRVRIGPGKGACMGRVGKTIVFNLPGGPPSNHVALLLPALPGVRRLMGWSNFLPQKRRVLVMEELIGQENWTQLIYSRVSYEGGVVTAMPLRIMGRLETMAAANGLIEIPEGTEVIKEMSQAEA